MNKCEFCNNEKSNLISWNYDICLDCIQKYYDKNVEYHPERHAKIMKLRLEKKTYREIAEIFGFTAVRARQIFLKVVRQVIHRLRIKEEKKDD